MKKPAAKKAKKAPAKKAAPRKKVVLLSGGNPQIAKADGDAPVQEYISALPGWKSDAFKRLDALIVKSVPKVRKAVKWNSPLYGLEGKGFFMGVHAFAKYLKVSFFFGAKLEPLPPVPSKDKNARYAHIYEEEAPTDAELARWIKQAAAIPGWVP
jgi:hypothetical protein